MMDLVDQLHRIDWGVAAAIFVITVFLAWFRATI